MKKRVVDYFDNKLTHKERLELLNRAQTDEELKSEFVRHQLLNGLLKLVPRQDDSKMAGASFRHFVHRMEKRKYNRIARRIIGYAAILCGLIAGTWITAGFYFSNPRSTNEEQPYMSLSVPAGQRLNLLLPDGTNVWLNSQTTLSYPTSFEKEERRVRIQGEAFFEVAKDSHRPFIVSFGHSEATVLGTTFNICYYPQEEHSLVSLLEGSLRVNTNGAFNNSCMLEPNEELLLSSSGTLKQQIQNNNHFLWIQGIYSFENETLGNILNKLELYYDISIDVIDPEMHQWTYTVKFRQRDSIKEILQLLQRIRYFKLKIDEEHNRACLQK